MYSDYQDVKSTLQVHQLRVRTDITSEDRFLRWHLFYPS